MKPRLPRKYKKQVKKGVEIANAFKSLRIAMISGMAAVQWARVISTPKSLELPASTTLAQKALALVEVTKNTAESISNIMNEHPKSWRDFIR